MQRFPDKAPGELLDYRVDWSARLTVNRVSDTITASTWSASPVGLTINTNTFTNPYTTVWISGGTLNETYTLTNTVTTQGGRTMVEEIQIKVK